MKEIILPNLEKLKRVIYVFEDNTEYEMIDVQNYVDNLKVSGGLLATRGYITMKPVKWNKITKENKCSRCGSDSIMHEQNH